MTEHPVTKHLDKLAAHHAHHRKRHHDEATRLATERDLVDRQRADLLAGKLDEPTDKGSDHGSSQP